MLITSTQNKIDTQAEGNKRGRKKKSEDSFIDKDIIGIWDGFFNELRTNTTDGKSIKIFITLNFMLILKKNKEDFVSYYENENLNLKFLYEEVNQYLYYKKIKIDLYEDVLIDYDLFVSKNSLDKYIKSFFEIFNNCEYIEKKFELYVMKKFNNVMTNNIRVSYNLIKLIKMLLREFDFKTIYDPAISTGNIISEVIKDHNVEIIEGQDISEFEVNITKMNLVLNENEKSVKNIHVGNSVIKPMNILEDKLKKFDCIVCNPPLNGEWGANIVRVSDEYNRFHRGIPPKNFPSFAYITHILESLSEHGVAVIVVPIGVMFRDGTEESIRKQLVSEGVIDTIIYLPPNMMEGASIPVNIMILNKAKIGRNIFMMDLTERGQIENGKKVFDDEFISKVASVYENKLDIKNMSKMITYEKIKENNFNLYNKRYICDEEYVEMYDFDDIAEEVIEIKEKMDRLNRKLFEIIMS